MIDDITIWHKRARENPTEKDFNVQLGCHIEEFVEMLDSITPDYKAEMCEAVNELEAMWEAVKELEKFANGLKDGSIQIHSMDREGLLDALADQIVTAVGVGVCAGMDMPKAVAEVNSSNWSKFNYRGYPEFDENGKIKKGEQYRKPNLEGMY
jgi:predicted HAD superfamily Cof-like phosphohydrolase